VVLDPPGHGRSGRPPRRFTLEATAEATREVLDAIEVETVMLIGGAWGGMVGLQLAASHPAYVRGLVLINSPLDRWRGWQRVEMSLLGLLLAAVGPKGVASLIARNMFSSHTRREQPDEVQRFTAAMRSFDRRSLSRSARSAMLRRPSLLPLLPHVDVPVLAIAGSDDVLWPVDRAARDVASIPNARFEIVDGTAHASAFEAPEVVNPLLLHHLATVGHAMRDDRAQSC
jgi:pimeloyl-ACP methyl ester carboxylesterase